MYLDGGLCDLFVMWLFMFIVELMFLVDKLLVIKFFFFLGCSNWYKIS